jgi:transposase
MAVIPLVEVSAEERRALATAAHQARRVREWRRYRAILLLAAGQEPGEVVKALGCGRASVYAWAADWRRSGLGGVAPRPHGGGRPRRVDRSVEARLDELLQADPQERGHASTGWTVPLMRAELAEACIAVAERTIRRALHRLGWRWKRPKYVLGRPDPAYTEKKLGRQNGLSNEAIF